MKEKLSKTALAATLAALSLAAPLSSGGATRAVPRLVFPVVGPVSYINDFGAPRGRLPHQGNDLMGTKKSIVVAVEAGTVTFWTHSASAGCMLYLHGRSGTMYEYIHLNNDLTMKNDNKGRCVAGTAYAKGLRNGARVEAGQPVGYLGDSGDANGIASHLHFEVHPRGGSAVSPYPYLRRARVLLFAAKPGDRVSLTLKGTSIAADTGAGTLSMRLTDLVASTGLHLEKLSRKITLALSPDTLVLDELGNNVPFENLDELGAGEPVQIETTSVPTTLASELGSSLSLTTFSVTILG
ncbi:MAG: M23 family metallopeptidase [Gaiellaceae bacterium]